MAFIQRGKIETGYKTQTNGESIAGMGQTNHSAAGPNLSTTAHAKIPRAIPKRKSSRRNGTRNAPNVANDKQKTAPARISITTSPIELDTTLEVTRPVMYSDRDSGE